MIIFKKNVLLLDFVPPIFIKSIRLLKKFINKVTKKNIFYFDQEVPYYIDPHFNSYSQYQEDLILGLLLSSKKSGFYVDIGANDPVFLNNTLHFYKNGWSGINVEPDPRLYKKISDLRTKDINLNIGIGPKSGLMNFYKMSADTLSTFNKKAAIKNGKIHSAKLISVEQIEVKPLSEIFEVYLKNKEIDFISVDVEGFELSVLKSNDWEKFRPTIIMAEINHEGLSIIEYLKSNGYSLIYSNKTNGIFIDNTKKELLKNLD